MILTWVSHAAVQPTIDQSRHGCKQKPENIRSNSKSLPTLATIVVENYAAVAANLNNVMHAKPDLRVFLKWRIAGSGSVITDVIRLNIKTQTYAAPFSY